MLGQQSINSCVDEIQFPEDVGDVKLVVDRIAALLELLDGLPVGVAPQHVEEPLQVVEEEVCYVEGVRRDDAVLVVDQHLFA